MLMPRIYHENLFDDFFGDFPFFDDGMQSVEKKLYGHNASRMMSTDIKQKDDGYELEMDLPGFKKEEIQISLENGYLTISAAKGLDETREEKPHYIRRERYAGACSRSFYVGQTITQDQIRAEFHHGILKLFVPREDAVPAIEQKKYIAIEG